MQVYTSADGPAAGGPIAILGQEIYPTLARRKGEHVREGHEDQPGQDKNRHGGHAHVACAAQAESGAQIEAVENLIAGGEPQQSTTEGDDGVALGSVGLTNSGTSQGPMKARNTVTKPM